MALQSLGTSQIQWIFSVLENIVTYFLIFFKTYMQDIPVSLVKDKVLILAVKKLEYCVASRWHGQEQCECGQNMQDAQFPIIDYSFNTSSAPKLLVQQLYTTYPIDVIDI